MYAQPQPLQRLEEVLKQVSRGPVLVADSFSEAHPASLALHGFFFAGHDLLAIIGGIPDADQNRRVRLDLLGARMLLGQLSICEWEFGRELSGGFQGVRQVEVNPIWRKLAAFGQNALGQPQMRHRVGADEELKAVEVAGGARRGVGAHAGALRLSHLLQAVFQGCQQIRAGAGGRVKGGDGFVHEGELGVEPRFQ